MIPTHDADLEPSIQALIDRMIDGEMSPEQLRTCIQRLDSTPDGWRRCALAFLEAQSWGEAFRNLDQSPRDRDLALAAFTEPPPVSRARVVRRGPARTALAAGIALIAFSLGWMGHGLRVRSEPATAPVERASSSLVVHAVRASGPTSSKTLEPGAIAGLPVNRVPTVREVARLRFGPGDQTAAEIPILAGPGISRRWLLEQPPPVSEHDQALWQRRGYHLEQRRRLVSVPLADGRRAAVPIDHVQVRYVGHDPL